jgi:hypothetical protein
VKRVVRCARLPALASLTGCTSGGSYPATPAGGFTRSVDQNLHDQLVRLPPPGASCGIGSYRLVQQRIRATDAAVASALKELFWSQPMPEGAAARSTDGASL